MIYTILRAVCKIESGILNNLILFFALKTKHLIILYYFIMYFFLGELKLWYIKY